MILMSEVTYYIVLTTPSPPCMRSLEMSTPWHGELLRVLRDMSDTPVNVITWAVTVDRRHSDLWHNVTRIRSGRPLWTWYVPQPAACIFCEQVSMLGEDLCGSYWTHIAGT